MESNARNSRQTFELESESAIIRIAYDPVIALENEKTNSVSEMVAAMSNQHVQALARLPSPSGGRISPSSRFLRSKENGDATQPSAPASEPTPASEEPAMMRNEHHFVGSSRSIVSSRSIALSILGLLLMGLLAILWRAARRKRAE
jgi:hypothetical protein